MADIKTTLHREDAPQDNVYPNIVADNIPANSIDHTKVDGTIPSLSSAPTSADSGKVVTVDENGDYELKAVTGAVTSVNGQTGVVTISKYDLGLAAVALSGSYDDLTDKPPAAAVTSVNGQTGTVTISKYDLGLANVALTGSYNDLTDKPDISSGGVTSVNGQTGVVTISKYDLGLADIALTGDFHDLRGYNVLDAGKYLRVDDDGTGVSWVSGTSSGVTSVNGQTGVVTISKYDLGLADVALTGSYNDLRDKPDISSGGVTSVNGQTGVVTISKHDLGLGLVDNEPQLVADAMNRYGFNFNNISNLPSGLYTAWGSSDLPLSNAPDGDKTGKWAVLILKVANDYDYAIELAFSFTSNKIYTRRYYTSWSAWTALL